MTDVVNKSSGDEIEEKQRTLSLTENSPTSGGTNIESEYDTASTNSRSDNEQNEYEDDEEDSLEASDEATDEGDEVIDDERESGDGQEEQENETKKKLDHDQDRSNPQFIPKKGTFYEHDDRTEDFEPVEEQENADNITNSNEALSNSSKILSTQNQKVTPKLVKKTKEADCWAHDRFNVEEQAPKSRTELVSSYGYDIRNEDCAPRPRRQRRYGRHQLKYSRNWEDEEAYKKTQAIKIQSRRPLRPEDFPALGSNKVSSKPRKRSIRQQDENDPQSSSNYRSPTRNREQRDDYGGRDERGSREPRGQRYNNDTSTNNNVRNNVKGKKNINFNHNIEFKNQNRKNINYESTQPKNNNILNQQMQTSSSAQHVPPSQSGQSGQRYNNEAPVSSMSFTNSKMNNANNNSNAAAAGSSRTILNFDNSSGNYGRGSREKEVNSQQQLHQQQQQIQQMSSNQGPTMSSPNKNLQYTDHQIDQIKLMEKSYQQQQGKATNLNLNQVAQHQPMNNVPEVQMMNNSEMTRSKRYSVRQRSNLNENPSQGTAYHQQYHQQDIDQQAHAQMPAQQTPAYIPQQTQTPATMMSPQTVPPTATQATNVQQPPNQKYQAAYYPSNPANEYAAQQAALMNAMVEKYQYQQPPAPPQYLPQQQPQQIYMPSQSQTTQQQQILNYVSTIQPQAPAATPAYPQYTNYQNYNIQAPAAAAPVPPQPSQAAPQTQPTQQPIYQTQSGLTYYPNAQMAPVHPPRIIQPQRRPNPIPILAPPDHKKNQGSSIADDSEKVLENEKGESGTENIDHILDNMFVQRQPFEPAISIKDNQTLSAENSEDKVDQLNDGINAMTVNEHKTDDM